MIQSHVERYRHEIVPLGERYYNLISGYCKELLVDPIDVPHLTTDLGNIYHTYAWLFRPTFPEMPLETFQAIALVGRHYLTEALMMDRLCDGECHWPAAYALIPSIVQEGARDILSELFPTHSPFWQLFAEQQQNYRRCIALEKQHQGRLKPYEDGEFHAIATGVMAKAKLITGALIHLSGELYLQEPALRSQDHFALADRIMDDVTDWRDDLAAGNFTSLLTDAAPSFGVTDPGELDAETVGRALYLNGHLERYLQMALDSAEAALDDGILLRSKAWCEHLVTVHEQIRSRLVALRRVLQKVSDGQVADRG